MTRSLMVLALCAPFVGAQAPANDLCGGAPPLVVGVNTVGTTVGAGAEGPACGTGFPATTIDVFYTYTPAVDEACTLVRLGAGSTSGVNRAAAFTGVCSALTAVSCVNNVPGSTLVTWLGQAGVSYTIRLGTVMTPAAFTVLLTTAPPLANDDCATPTILSDGVNPGAPAGANGSFFTSTGATTGLAPTGVACGFPNPANDVWFQYTATVGGLTVIRTCTPTSFSSGSFTDTNLQVFTGACGALVEVACDDDACTGGGNDLSSVSIAATAGVTYLIRVSGAPSGSPSSQSGTFYVTVIAPPPNDECLGATGLAIGPNAGTTLGATADLAAPTGSCVSFLPSTVDVWHQFSPAVDCTVVLTRSGSGASAMGIYSGSCGALTPYACTTGTTLSAVVFGGTTYRLRVARGGPTGGAYSIDYQCAPLPANDECTGAVPLALGVNAGTTADATPSVGVAVLCGGFGPSVIDVWHTFTAPTPANYVFTRTGIDASAFAVSTGGCSSPTGNVGCGSTVSHVMAAGATVYLRVGSSAGNPYTITIASAPSNDTILGAIPVSLGVNPSAPNGVDGLTFTNVGTNVAPDTNGGTIPGPSCAVIENDVFFLWVAPTTCAYTVSLCTPTGFAPGTLTDPMLQVLDGTGTAELGCNDDSCGLLSSVTFSATGGSTYYFRAGAWQSSSPTGTFYVTVTPEPYAVHMTAPFGPTTFQTQNLCGVPGNLYLNFFTLVPGAFPNGNWFGLTMSIYEIQYQMTAGVAPLFGFLDAAGQATFGPLFGAPSGLTVYAVSLQFDPLGSFVAASPPASFLIP
jgi:hypothetical protein